MGRETIFPHLTSTRPAPSYREVVAAYRTLFDARVADGKLRPLVLPYHLYGCLLLLIYLCIPHTASPLLYAARWPVLVVIILFQWKTIWETSSMSMAIGLASGLAAAWGMALAVTWLVLYRPQFDAKRVQRRRVKRVRTEYMEVTVREEHNGGATQSNGSQIEGYQLSTDDISIVRASAQKGLNRRSQANGSAHAKKVEGLEDLDGHPNAKPYEVKADDENDEYYWQSYPDNLLERVPWLLDLLMNFRGPGWNWAISPIPSIPLSIRFKLGEQAKDTAMSGISSVRLRRFNTRRELFMYRMAQFIGGYLLLDILKTTIMKDPYYIFGPTTYALPTHLQNLSPFQLRLFRQCLTSLTVVVALEMVFILAPLTFCLLLGPRVLGLRGEAWYYPTTWGSFSNVLNQGLNGMWGGWWHQTFRFVFSAPTNFLIENGYIRAHSKKAKLLALFFAFGISGMLHACGSVSQLPHTYPLHAPIFFMLQALGIFIQRTLCSSWHPYINALPKVLRQVGNLLFTWTWLWYTASWLVDDFARGGVLLWEPIPISPMRALGYGVRGDWWWCWDDIGVRWYTGNHWWESGIAI